MLIFNPEFHSYKSIQEDGIDWTSVTTLISKFKTPFDPDTAKKVSKKKTSKWYGLSEEEIKRIWKEESTRSTDLGTWYHNKRELELLGKQCPSIIAPNCDENGCKFASSQLLEKGMQYPEILLYNKNMKVCGQADYVSVDEKGIITIRDYKSNKSIDKESFKDWNGKSKKMLAPLQHLDDCNFTHYSLQLSFYMYIIMKSNPHLTPGSMIIEHIIFKQDGENEWGYPIHSRDEYNNPIVEKIIEYPVKYMKDEVVKILNYIK